MENTELPKDTFRELYLEKCTPEQHIELLELEIKNTEEQMNFYEKSPLKNDLLQQAIMKKRYQAHIENKSLQIKKLQKKIQQ